MRSKLARTAAVIAFGAASFASPGALAESVLRHVPQADLKVLDPVTNTAFITMQFAFMVYDQLFSVDENYEPHPQMVESYTVSDDRKSYRFTLRPGLKFHDGSPVRAADAVASIGRWAMKDPAGGKMAALGMKLDVVDDRSFTLSLNEPFGPVIDSMAKPSWALFVMPEKEIANRPVSEAVTSANGSGPFRLVRSAWVPGAKIVFERNPDYVSRSEPARFYSGGKVVKVDRVEWDIIPDMSTAVSALTKGEIDSIENVSFDLVPGPEARQRDCRRHPQQVGCPGLPATQSSVSAVQQREGAGGAGARNRSGGPDARGDRRSGVLAGLLGMVDVRLADRQRDGRREPRQAGSGGGTATAERGRLQRREDRVDGPDWPALCA